MTFEDLSTDADIREHFELLAELDPDQREMVMNLKLEALKASALLLLDKGDEVDEILEDIADVLSLMTKGFSNLNDRVKALEDSAA